MQEMEDGPLPFIIKSVLHQYSTNTYNPRDTVAIAQKCSIAIVTRDSHYLKGSGISGLAYVQRYDFAHLDVRMGWFNTHEGISVLWLLITRIVCICTVLV